MNREKYIKYLFDETVKAEETAQVVTKELNLDEMRSLSLTSIVETMRGFLVYLRGNEAYNFKENLIFPEEPCSIEIYAIERSLKDMCWLFFKDSPNVAVLYAYCTQILRATLAIHLQDKGVLASCLAYESYDYKEFSVTNATERDIERAAFDCMEFKCPDTNANFYLSSFDDGNSFDFLK